MKKPTIWKIVTIGMMLVMISITFPVQAEQISIEDSGEVSTMRDDTKIITIYVYRYDTEEPVGGVLVKCNQQQGDITLQRGNTRKDGKIAFLVDKVGMINIYAEKFMEGKFWRGTDPYTFNVPEYVTYIDVKLKPGPLSKNKALLPMNDILINLLEKHPHLFPLLQRLLKL